MNRPDPAEMKLLAQTRLDALRARPYFAQVIFALQPVAVDGLGTLAVDASARLYIDFEALERWSPPERAAVLVHEVTHLLHDHHARAKRYGALLHPRRWNIAADAEINDDIGLPLPAGAITPATLGQEPHRLAEHYYDNLDDDGIDGHAPSCGSCAGGPPRPWEQSGDAAGLAPSDVDAIRRQVSEAIRNAPPGTVPAGDARWADAASGPPAVSWQRHLRVTVTGHGRGPGTAQWTYSRPGMHGAPHLLRHRGHVPRTYHQTSDAAGPRRRRNRHEGRHRSRHRPPTPSQPRDRGDRRPHAVAGLGASENPNNRAPPRRRTRYGTRVGRRRCRSAGA